MSFEHRLRVEAFKLVRDEGYTLSKALDHVVADSDLRSLHFVTSLTVSNKGVHAKASASRLAPPEPPQAQASKRQRREEKKQRREDSGPGGKGKDKGKKSKGRDPHRKRIDPNLQLVARTPDGRDICWKYNTGTCSGGCGRVHCCRVKGCTHAGPACEHPH